LPRASPLGVEGNVEGLLARRGRKVSGEIRFRKVLPIPVEGHDAAVVRVGNDDPVVLGSRLTALGRHTTRVVEGQLAPPVHRGIANRAGPVDSRKPVKPVLSASVNHVQDAVAWIHGQAERLFENVSAAAVDCSRIDKAWGVSIVCEDDDLGACGEKNEIEISFERKALNGPRRGDG